MEDFGHELRHVIKFCSSKGGSSMEDQERETRTDEDVEGHGPAKGAPGHGAPAKGRQDEPGDDVEAHGPAKGAPAHGAPAHGRQDEGDDVEAHKMFGAPAKGQPAKG